MKFWELPQSSKSKARQLHALASDAHLALPPSAPPPAQPPPWQPPPAQPPLRQQPASAPASAQLPGPLRPRAAGETAVVKTLPLERTITAIVLVVSVVGCSQIHAGIYCNGIYGNLCSSLFVAFCCLVDIPEKNQSFDGWPEISRHVWLQNLMKLMMVLRRLFTSTTSSITCTQVPYRDTMRYIYNNYIYIYIITHIFIFIGYFAFRDCCPTRILLRRADRVQLAYPRACSVTSPSSVQSMSFVRSPMSAVAPTYLGMASSDKMIWGIRNQQESTPCPEKHRREGGWTSSPFLQHSWSSRVRVSEGQPSATGRWPHDPCIRKQWGAPKWSHQSGIRRSGLFKPQACQCIVAWHVMASGRQTQKSHEDN